MSSLLELEYPILIVFVVLMTYMWIGVCRKAMVRRREFYKVGEQLLREAAENQTDGSESKIKFCNPCQLKHEWDAEYCRNCGKRL